MQSYQYYKCTCGNEEFLESYEEVFQCPECNSIMKYIQEIPVGDDGSWDEDVEQNDDGVLFEPYDDEKYYDVL